MVFCLLLLVKVLVSLVALVVVSSLTRLLFVLLFALADNVPPVPMITSLVPNPTNDKVMLVTITFTEPVINYSEAMILVSNGAAVVTDLTPASGPASVYTAVVTADGE